MRSLLFLAVLASFASFSAYAQTQEDTPKKECAEPATAAVAPIPLAEITDADFAAKVIQSDQPTVVEFYADWCVYCNKMAPSLEQVAGEYAGKIQIYKMNFDNNKETVNQYEVEGIPTLLYFKNGKLVDREDSFLLLRSLRFQMDRFLFAPSES